MTNQLKQYEDIRGLSLTAYSHSAVTDYDDCINAIFEYRADTMKRLKGVLAQEPTMPMAICLQGYLFLMINSRTVHDRVTAAIQALDAQSEQLNPREALHRQALKYWSCGDDLRACGQWYQILCQYPLDILAIRLLHGAAFWIGNATLLHDCTASVLLRWTEDCPGYNYVIGMHAFALEELGQYEQAERLGLQAMEMNRADLWALHAVAHVYEMQSRLKEGSQLLDLPGDSLDDRNPFRGHIWWHAAMFALDRGAYDKVLAIYDESIHSIESTFFLDVQNTASLLVRLDLRGVDVAHRWKALADIAEQQLDDHVLAFTEMHYAMSLAADHRSDAVRAHLDSLREFVRSNDGWAASVMATTGVALCQAVAAHRQGDYETFVTTVLPLRHRLSDLGGSHAQRDVFDQLLLDAAIKSGRLALARALVSERIARRPGNPDNWQWYGEINDQLGHTEESEQAMARGRALRC